MRILPIVLGLAFAGGLIGEARAEPAELCSAHAIAVVLNVSTRILSLCERGKTQRQFPVALGIGGLGKRQKGESSHPARRLPSGTAPPLLAIRNLHPGRLSHAPADGHGIHRHRGRHPRTAARQRE